MLSFTPQPVIDNFIKKTILNKFKKSIGQDQITVEIIKKSAEYIPVPLLNIINQSLKNIVFPYQIKYLEVKPLFKNGNSTDNENYSAVSVLPIILKIFQTIMNQQMLTLF